MLFLISEKVAALYQRFQHAEINFFVGPFAFGKEGGIFVLLAHNVNFCLSFMDRIVAPPAAQGSEFHRGLSAQQQLPKVLLADFLKHLAHVVGKVRFDALIYQVCCAAGDQGSILRHKPVPEAEHVVVDEIDRLF